jgi:hypothetical protein
MALAGRRPQRRRRRWVLLGLVLTLIVLAVNAAVSSRSSGPGERQAMLGYIDGVRPIVDRSNQQGTELADLRNQALTLGRDGIQRRLDRVQREAASVLNEGRQLRPPARFRDAQDLFVAALAIRSSATGVAQQAFNDALGTTPPETAVTELADAGRSMAAADQAYSLFVAGVPGQSPPLAASRWVSDDQAWSVPLLTTFVASLRSSASLSPVHDLSVVLVSIDPTPVTMDGQTAVLPQAKNLRLQIVVADAGNEPEHRAAVTATLNPAAIGPTDTARDWVDLSPGQRRTVLLGTLRPAVNAQSTLTVRIDPTPGEVNTADNEKTISFVMR